MRFQQGVVLETLQGDSSLCNSLVSLKAMLKAIKGEGEAVLLELCSLVSSIQQQELTALVTISLLLVEYTDVFSEQQALPSVRAWDHAIVLQPGSRQVNVWLYRYPHHQKSEIERFVRDMLRAGIIQLNVSSFSSPVLLVKKKDGGWRFCVDYRSLNKVTTLDKFPIPIVDGLLDETRRHFEDDLPYSRGALRILSHALWTLQRADNISRNNEPGLS